MINSILIVEDDPLISEALDRWLSQEHTVVRTASLAQAIDVLAERTLDIVLLDVGLPDGSGFDLLQYIKRKKLTTGVLIITAYGEIDSRVKGLDLGADDYLVKPIDFKELDARIRAVKRRKEGLHGNVIEHGKLVFDIDGPTVSLNGEAIHLSNKEVSILSILLHGRDRYYNKAMLEDRLYHEGESFDGNAIEVHISSLRKKLGKSLIKTTRGLGYIIEKASANDYN